MTDEAFQNELWVACYKAQIDGYPLGHPSRTNFQPIVPRKATRKDTLDMGYYANLFTADDRRVLESEEPCSTQSST